MSIGYQIDDGRCVVFVRGWGTVANDDIAAVTSALAADSRFRPEFGAVVDMRNIDDDLITPAFLTQIRHSVFAEQSRRAFVVSRAVDYGMARMYQLMLGSDVIDVFRVLGEAYEWLGLPADTPWPEPVVEVPVPLADGATGGRRT